MRYTLRDMPRAVRRHGLRELGGWWEEWPPRTRRFWRTLLFEPGQGWLRWGFDDRVGYDHIDEGLSAPVDYRVAPPLRRAWLFLRAWPRAVRVVLFGYRYEGRYYRDLGWEEMRPIYPSDLKDDDRHRELWETGPRWRRR